MEKGGTSDMNRVLQLLRVFGLTMIESEVYVYLAKTGPQNIEDLDRMFGTTKPQFFRILRALKEKGVMVSNPQKPEVVASIPFEEILESYLKSNIDKMQKVAENRDELLSIWKDMKFKVN
jgi:sugar-specific transcriptional regulator TrmB